VIPAIVLAAGASTRMGRPKALLPVGSVTFVRRVLDTLKSAGLSEIAVVVRPDHDAVIAEIDAATIGRAVVNARAENGQLTSLIAGLDAVDAPGVNAVLVTLVDVPLIRSSTVRTLIARATQSDAPVLRAVHHGRHGHPVIYRRPVFDALRAADPSVGAKSVMRTVRIDDVEVDDPGVSEDIDTPEDYRRLLGVDIRLS
jgi:molybdenum cofactor cytidylyltransferase